MDLKILFSAFKNTVLFSEWFTELRNYYSWSFIIAKKTNLKQPKEEIHKLTLDRFPQWGFRHPQGRISLLALKSDIWRVLSTRDSQTHSVSRVFIEVSLHRHDRLNYCPCDLMSNPFTPKDWNELEVGLVSGGSKPNSLTMWLICLVWPDTS